MNVTGAIVGFVFVCIIFPGLIRNRAQFYGALGAVVVGLLLTALATLIGNFTLLRLVGAVDLLLQAAAIVLLVLATGGLTLGQLANDVSQAFGQTGDSGTTPIVPLSQQAHTGGTNYGRSDEEPGGTYIIDEAAMKATTPPPPPPPRG